MTYISRRSVLSQSGLAALALASATGSAVALIPFSAEAATTGELARLIEQHTAAYAALCESITALEAAGRDDEKDRFLLLSQGSSVSIRAANRDIWEIREQGQSAIQNEYSKFRSQVPHMLSDEARTLIERELASAQRAAYRRLVDLLAEVNRDRDVTGLNAAQQHYHECSERELDSAKAILRHPCRNAEERKLKASYLSRADATGRAILDTLYAESDFVDALLESIAAEASL